MGDCLYWCETKICAALTLKEQSENHETDPADAMIREYRVKPTRNDFVLFLNIHFTRDNG